MSPPIKASREQRPEAAKEERRAKRQRLALCKGKLSPEDAEILHEVFEDIFDDHSQLVWNYLRNRGIPDHDAEDLLQETFVLLHEHILDEGYPDKPGAMLITFADGKAKNFLRGNRRSPMSLGVPSSKSEVPLSGLDINRALDLWWLRWQLLPMLSPDKREVIEMTSIHGLSYRDAAEALNIPEGTLRSRLSAAKRVLEELAKPLLPASQRGPR